MRSTLEWAQARAMAADGRSQREIAARLGINRRTVKRMLESDEPPRYRRAPAGSKVDRFEHLIAATLEQCPEIKGPWMTEILREHGYEGSIDLVKRRLRALRPPAERPAQRTGYRPGQVLQLDWAEMPTRPRIAGRERRVYALIGSLPYSGAASAHFSFDMTLESFLEGHTRIFEWLGGVTRECVYDNLRSVVARREAGDVVRWNPRLSEPWPPSSLGGEWLRGLICSIAPRTPGLIWVHGPWAGDVMVDRSIRGERLRPLGLSGTAALGRVSSGLWEQAGRLKAISDLRAWAEAIEGVTAENQVIGSSASGPSSRRV